MKKNQINTKEIDANIVSLSTYFNIMYKERRFIFINILIVALISLIFAFIIPKTFRASCVLMPPIADNNRGVFGALDGIPLSSLFSQNNDQTMHFLAILKSRTIMESVIDKFNLIKFYKVEKMEDAISELEDNMRFEINEEGTIKISADVKTNWFHSYISQSNQDQIKS